MPPTSPSQYIVPHRTADDDHKRGWLREALEDGEAYLKSQRSWRDIDKAIDILSGAGADKLPKGMSRVFLNMVKRDVREAVATLANMRPIWAYKTDNSEFQNLATILNKMLNAWYHQTFADRSIRQALQYAAVCKGWLSPSWQSDFWVTGRGDIKLKVYGPNKVVPFQIGSDHDIQRAYVVTIKDEVPYALALAKYPTQIDKFMPTRSAPTWMRRGIRRVQKFLSPVLQQLGPGRQGETDESMFPTVDIYRSYILDLTYNDGDKPVLMGEDGTNWSYSVPPKDSLIETGEMTLDGKPTYRKATLEDSLIYPLRRLITWTDYGILYDNTATAWHAKVPLVSFQLDDWPWDFLGQSSAAEGDSIQRSNTNLMRAIEDSANCRLDPALNFDENILSQGLMERLKTRVPGQRIKSNMQMGDAIKPVLPANYYDVPTWILEHIKNLWEGLHYVMGTRDIQGLAKAKAMSGDSLEKAVELAGPLVTDMSRNMERSMRDLGEMVKGDMMQWYDLPRRVQLLGADGGTEEDFDYDPNNMIPSHLPDEMALIKKGTFDKNRPSRASIVQRAKAHINSCYFHVTPNSLHQITQLTRKMLYLQLWKGQFPIDPLTVAEALDIPNFGTAEKLAKAIGSDQVPRDVLGRWIAWQELKAKLGEALQGGGMRGRKPSGQVPPAMQQKDGGSRSTVRESPR